MPLNTALLAELKHESVNTKKILERVPTDKLSWKPHEKSMTLGRLATHLAELPTWIDRIISADEFDFAKPLARDSKVTTDEIIALFNEELLSATKSLESATDENLNANWTVKRGDVIFFQMPRKIALRNFAFNHIYHHRGQLSVYLRLLDVNVPGMYGPSADELKF